MKFNFSSIINVLGILLMICGGFMLFCVPFSLFYKENDWLYILFATAITLSAGFTAWWATKNIENKELKKKDGYLIVTFGWIMMSLFGTLPYILTGEIPNFTNAFFETVSGFTTTGASVLTDIESVSKGILLWRSITQWIGGLGFVVLAVAILPILGIGGMQLFTAESPGLSPDKLKPRIKDTAIRLWFIYLGLTFAETIFLMFGGMTFFDAFNHGLTTMATGGFSTKNASAAEFTPYIQYVIALFMFFAGTNFAVIYYLGKRKFNKVWGNEEFRFYSLTIVILTTLVGVSIYIVTNHSFEKSFRDGLFQVLSILTTTGYVSADYTAWTPFLTIIFFLLMFIGGSTGSTAGGVKILRHIILFKNSSLELKRQLHPSAVIPVRINGKAVSPDTVYNILAFFVLYLSIFALGTIAMALIGLDFMTALGAVATSLGNIGPGLGNVGPVDNFAMIPSAGKWLLSLLMILGRLELFTVLMLFTAYFWRRF